MNKPEQKLNLLIIIGALLVPLGALLGGIGLIFSANLWLRTSFYFAGFVCCVLSVFITLRGAKSALPGAGIGESDSTDPADKEVVESEPQDGSSSNQEKEAADQA